MKDRVDRMIRAIPMTRRATERIFMATTIISHQQMNRRLYWGIAISLFLTTVFFYAVRGTRTTTAPAPATTPVVTEPAAPTSP